MVGVRRGIVISAATGLSSENADCGLQGRLFWYTPFSPEDEAQAILSKVPAGL